MGRKNQHVLCHPERARKALGMCRKCYEKDYRKKNLEKRAQSTRDWHSRNPGRRLQIQHKYRSNNVEKYLFRAARLRSLKLGRNFSITVDDIKIPKKCPYLNIELKHSSGRGRGARRASPSLDRKDNSLGYEPGNVEVISTLANRMKGDASSSELVLFAKEIIRRYG